MLKDEKFCDVIYGRSHYDYDKGTVVCTAPGQVIGIENTTDETFQPKGWGLFFKPELVHGTSLARNMKEYSFFEYSANEALHLSERERETFMHYLHEIEAELDHSIDRLTRRLIASNVEYCWTVTYVSTKGSSLPASSSTRTFSPVSSNC